MEAGHSHSQSPGPLHRQDSWTCHRCGWVYPNPHPSAKHRRNHKKHCGKIKDFELRSTIHDGGSSDDASSDDESRCNKGIGHKTPGSHVISQETGPLPKEKHISLLKDTGSSSAEHSEIKTNLHDKQDPSLDCQPQTSIPQSDSNHQSILPLQFIDASPIISLEKENGDTKMLAEQDNAESALKSEKRTTTNAVVPTEVELKEENLVVSPVKDTGTMTGNFQTDGSSDSNISKCIEPSRNGALQMEGNKEVHPLIEGSGGDLETSTEGLERGEENVRSLQVAGQDISPSEVSRNIPPSHTPTSEIVNAENVAMKEDLNLNTISSGSESKDLSQNGEAGGLDGKDLTKIAELPTGSSSEKAVLLGETVASGPSHTPTDENVDAENVAMKEDLNLNTISSGPESKDLTQNGEAGGSDGKDLTKVAELPTGSSSEQALLLGETVANGPSYTPTSENVDAENLAMKEDLNLNTTSSGSKSKDLTQNGEAGGSNGKDLTEVAELPTGSSSEQALLLSETVASVPSHTPTSENVEAENEDLKLNTISSGSESKNLTQNDEAGGSGDKASTEVAELPTGLSSEQVLLLDETVASGLECPSDRETEIRPNEINPGTVTLEQPDQSISNSVRKAVLEEDSIAEGSLSVLEGTQGPPQLPAEVEDRGEVKVGSSPPDFRTETINQELEKPDNEVLQISNSDSKAALEEDSISKNSLIAIEGTQSPRQLPAEVEDVDEVKEGSVPPDLRTETIDQKLEKPDNEAMQRSSEKSEEMPQGVVSVAGLPKKEKASKEDSQYEALSSSSISCSPLSESVNAEASSDVDGTGLEKDGETQARFGSTHVMENVIGPSFEQAVIPGITVASSLNSPSLVEAEKNSGLVIQGPPDFPTSDLDCKGESENDSVHEGQTVTEGQIQPRELSAHVDHKDTSNEGSFPSDLRAENMEQQIEKPDIAKMERFSDRSESKAQEKMVSEAELMNKVKTVDENIQEDHTTKIAAHGDPGDSVKESDSGVHLQSEESCEVANEVLPGIISSRREPETVLDTGIMSLGGVKSVFSERSDSIGTETYEDAPENFETGSVGGSIDENEMPDDSREVADGRLEGTAPLYHEQHFNLQGVASSGGKVSEMSIELKGKPNVLNNSSSSEVVPEEKNDVMPKEKVADTSTIQDLRAPSPEAWQELGTSEVGSEDNEVQAEQSVQPVLKSSHSEVKEHQISDKEHTPLRSLLAKEGSEKLDQNQKTPSEKGEGTKKLEGKWGSHNDQKPKSRSIWSHCICCPAVH